MILLRILHVKIYFLYFNKIFFNLKIVLSFMKLAQSGGGLAVTGANYVYLYDTTFDSCYGDYGGGAMIEELVFLYLNNIKFVDNTATSSGNFTLNKY